MIAVVIVYVFQGIGSIMHSVIMALGEEEFRIDISG